MKFTVKDLKQIAIVSALSGANDDESIDDFLRECQPNFYSIIEEVGGDPRCYDVYRFCANFCCTSLVYAIKKISEPLPIFSYTHVYDLLCFITQKNDLKISKRAITYPDRIQKHVLYHFQFDEDDLSWLCSIISTFLVLIENAS